MLTQNMLIHTSNPMLLFVVNHTFLPFGGTTNIITLANQMANHTTHNLKQNRICLNATIHHKKMSRERHYAVKVLFNLG
jgi:hypothetical protein